MPIYDWVCTECDLEVTRVAKIGEHEQEPSDGEAGPSPMKCKHKWKRIIKSTFINKSSNWGPGKGRW